LFRARKTHLVTFSGIASGQINALQADFELYICPDSEKLPNLIARETAIRGNGNLKLSVNADLQLMVDRT